MECNPAENRMLMHYACTEAELSCVIGNLFTELHPPCAHCGENIIIICGTTVTGNAATLYITNGGFSFDGCQDDVSILERIRKERCVHARKGIPARK